VSEEKAVLFRIGEKAYTIALAQVKEVCCYDKLISPAGVPHWMAGVARRYGAATPVVDLADRLGLSATTEPEQDSALILKTECGQEIGIVVDEVIDIIHNPDPASFLDLNELFSQAEIRKMKNAG